MENCSSNDRDYPVLWAWVPDIASTSIIRLVANIWFAIVALLTVYSGLNYLQTIQKTSLKRR